MVQIIKLLESGSPTPIFLALECSVRTTILSVTPDPSTNSISQHPGGSEVLLEVAGTDSTYSFEDVGHSLDARELLDQYYVGELHEVKQSAYLLILTLF